MLIGESACRTTFSIRSNRLGHTAARAVGDGRWVVSVNEVEIRGGVGAAIGQAA